MKILVSALEHSANIHLKSVVQRLENDVELVGIFDQELGSSIVDLRSLAVMGFIDVLKKFFFFLDLNTKMVELAKDVDKILLIDSSGFNLPLAKKIKKKYPEKEIIYYILPQAWAWRSGRINVLEKTVDKLCSILPFEKNFYSQESSIEYVGHPLLDQIKNFKSSLNNEIKTLLFMPGSRKGEIKKLMPIYQEVRKNLKELNAILVIPSFFTKDEINELYGDIKDFKVRSDAHQCMNEADFAFICSGTATLEASLVGIPFILTYIAKSFDFFIAKQLVKIKYIGLANIMFSKINQQEFHPELLQEDVNANKIFEVYKNYNRKLFLEKSLELRKYLKHGSAEKIALCLS